jgi:hypothetical protein
MNDTSEPIDDHACREAAGIPDDDEPTGEGVAP